ncbi:hypothetical protein SHIRM173S_08916 [Streptomyces hirsutus]
MNEGSAGRPGALPAQALDHGTGYLLAAAVLRALAEQADEGGSRFVRLALARTAAWLLEGAAPTRAPGGDRTAAAPGPASASASASTPTPVPTAGGSAADWLTETDSALGRPAVRPVPGVVHRRPP